MTGLFLAGLALFVLWSGKDGLAQNKPHGIPLPPEKPVIETIDVLPARKAESSVEAPVPDNKPVMKETKENNIILASLPPDRVALPKRQILGWFQKDSAAFLSNKQQALYREIFALERTGDFDQSDKLIRKLHNRMLVGHVMATRYLRDDYVSTYHELVSWLKAYSDHPQAHDIYDLMMIKKPGGISAAVGRPEIKSLLSGRLGSPTAREKRYIASSARNAIETADIMALERQIRRLSKQYKPTEALRLLNNEPAGTLLDDVEYDRMRALIAAGYLYAGNTADAMNLARASWERSSEEAPLSGWIYGLSLWKEGQYQKAAEAFEATATSSYASGWMVSASSFWAARAYGKVKNKEKEIKFLETAASYKRTFYGVIATQALNKDPDYNWSAPVFDKTARQAIEQTRSGKRALALLEIGKADLAEQELLLFRGALSKDHKRALIALANKYKLPALQMRLGSLYEQGDGALYDAALYPWAPWEPEGGYRLDKALIHAFIRQESRFDVNAKNPSGATGLMQLMPRTASYIAGHERYQTPQGQEQLKNPHINLALGQDYIAHLLEHKVVKGDLLSLAVAYNAGPGTLSRWKEERQDITDPLLFIETIPYAETRAFVERILANYWIYKNKAGETSPSLKAVARGQWALFAGEILPKTTKVASR